MEQPVTTLRRLLDSTIEDLEKAGAAENTLMKVLEASALVRSEELRLADLAVPDNWPNTASDPAVSMVA